MIHFVTGKKIDRGTVSHSLQGSSSSKMFKAFNGLGIIAFSFGDAMLPEIQVKDLTALAPIDAECPNNAYYIVMFGSFYTS